MHNHQSITFTNKCILQDYKLYISFKNSCMYLQQNTIFRKVSNEKVYRQQHISGKHSAKY